MSKVILTTEFNFSKFELSGFYVYDSIEELKSNLETLKTLLDNPNISIEFNFGNNETGYFDTYKDYESGISIKEVLDEEYDTIVTVFNSKYFGLPITPEFLLELV